MKREQDDAGRKQRLLSSGKTIAGSEIRVWPRRCAVIAATAAWALLPIEVSASWLSDVFSPKSDKAAKQATSPKRAAAAKAAASPKSRAEKPAAPKPVETCNPTKFRIVLDVGHTKQSEGASS